MTESSAASKWHAVEAVPEDSPAIRVLFEKVFKQEMSESHWEWKYKHNRGEGVVVKHGDDVVAFYGAVKRRVSCRGVDTNTLQCVDTMVDTSQRGSLSKKGPYYLAATTFLQKHIGFHKPYLFGFGFPNARVMKLGEILGVQADIGSVFELEWKPAFTGIVTGEEITLDQAQHGALVEKFWLMMRKDLTDRIATVRDIDYLIYRYNENPTHRYQTYLVSDDAGKNLGILVARINEGRLLVLDIVASLKNYPLIIQFAQSLASTNKLSAVSTWLTEPDVTVFNSVEPSTKADAQAGVQADIADEVSVKDIGVRIPTSVCSPGPSPDSLQDAWFLIAGDTDFL